MAILAVWRSGFRRYGRTSKWGRNENGPDGTNRQGLRGSFTRPDLAIPCRVAPQRCSALFHQASSLYPRQRKSHRRRLTQNRRKRFHLICVPRHQYSCPHSVLRGPIRTGRSAQVRTKHPGPSLRTDPYILKDIYGSWSVVVVCPDATVRIGRPHSPYRYSWGLSFH